MDDIESLKIQWLVETCRKVVGGDFGEDGKLINPQPGRSITAVANMLGVSDTTLNNWLSGNFSAGSMKLDNLDAIAAMLGVELSDLMAGYKEFLAQGRPAPKKRLDDIKQTIRQTLKQLEQEIMTLEQDESKEQVLRFASSLQKFLFINSINWKSREDRLLLAQASGKFGQPSCPWREVDIEAPSGSLYQHLAGTADKISYAVLASLAISLNALTGTEISADELVRVCNGESIDCLNPNDALHRG